MQCKAIHFIWFQYFILYSDICYFDCSWFPSVFVFCSTSYFDIWIHFSYFDIFRLLFIILTFSDSFFLYFDICRLFPVSLSCLVVCLVSISILLSGSSSLWSMMRMTICSDFLFVCFNVSTLQHLKCVHLQYGTKQGQPHIEDWLGGKSPSSSSLLLVFIINMVTFSMITAIILIIINMMVVRFKRAWTPPWCTPQLCRIWEPTSRRRCVFSGLIMMIVMTMVMIGMIMMTMVMIGMMMRTRQKTDNNDDHFIITMIRIMNNYCFQKANLQQHRDPSSPLHRDLPSPATCRGSLQCQRGDGGDGDGNANEVLLMVMVEKVMNLPTKFVIAFSSIDQ